MYREATTSAGDQADGTKLQQTPTWCQTALWPKHGCSGLRSPMRHGTQGRGPPQQDTPAAASQSPALPHAPPGQRWQPAPGPPALPCACPCPWPCPCAWRSWSSMPFIWSCCATAFQEVLEGGNGLRGALTHLVHLAHQLDQLLRLLGLVPGDAARPGGRQWGVHRRQTQQEINGGARGCAKRGFRGDKHKEVSGGAMPKASEGAPAGSKGSRGEGAKWQSHCLQGPASQ